MDRFLPVCLVVLCVACNSTELVNTAPESVPPQPPPPTAAPSPSPTPQGWLASSFSVGDLGACAVTTLGALWCWGIGISISSTPVQVPGLESGVIAVAAGGHHRCAIVEKTNEARKLMCWGANANGQIGIGEPYDVGHILPTPVEVTGVGPEVIDVTAGSRHTCALLETSPTERHVLCWGANANGQLGIGVTPEGYTLSSAVPVGVLGLPPEVYEVSAGERHTCAIARKFPLPPTAMCWGGNANAQIGIGEPYDVGAGFPIPVEVTGLVAGVQSIRAGSRQTCILTDAGAVKCWGLGYDSTPVEVSPPGTAFAVAAGLGGQCLVTVAGTVQCNLGTTPEDVPGLSSVVAVDVEGRRTCVLLDSGKLKCWGYPPLGDGGGESSVPVDVLQ